MTTEPDTQDPASRSLSDAGATEGRLKPLWVLTFGVPGGAMLVLWGMRVLIGLRFDPMIEVLFSLSLAIPAIELIRLPFLLSQPAPRPKAGDFVLTIWGILANGWPVAVTGVNPWTLLFFVGLMLYGLALVLLADTSTPARMGGSR